MRIGDTIAAGASGAGRALRAVVRLSGPGVAAVLDRVLDHSPESAGLHRARFRLAIGRGGEALMPCLVLRFEAPRSYTGEDAAEIQIAGHPALVDRVVQQILALEGVRPAGPGEFTARAFLRGKMSLDQAEGVAAAITARNQSELSAAESLLSGETGRAYRDLADEIARLLALVEAGIDFTDQEEVVAIEPARLAHSLRNCLFGLDCFLGPASDESPTHEPRVVLVGPPNAGKSTLFNALLGRRRTVVSPTAGTTRDAIEERLDLSAEAGLWSDRQAVLVDVAGLDASLADRSAEDRAGQAAALRAVEQADLIVHCDPSGDFASLGAETGTKPVVRVRTKADRPVARAGDAAGVIAVCAIEEWNLPALRRAIAEAIIGPSAGATRARVAPRHRRALAAARAALQRAITLVGPGEASRGLRSPEVVAGEIRLALDAIGEIVGRVTADDVLGRVFSLFCIGK